MTTNLLAAGNTALTHPEEAATILGVEEDQLAGRGRMICTRARVYRERPVKARWGKRPDKAVVEPEPREEGGRYGKR